MRLVASELIPVYDFRYRKVRLLEIRRLSRSTSISSFLFSMLSITFSNSINCHLKTVLLEFFVVGLC